MSITIDDIAIDKSFSEHLPPLLNKERELLMQSIRDERRVRNPLVCWQRNGKPVLVEGHHRLAIFRELQKADPDFQPPAIEEMKFKDKNAVLEWLDREHCGRRQNAKAYVWELGVELAPDAIAAAKARKAAGVAQGGLLHGKAGIKQLSPGRGMTARKDLQQRVLDRCGVALSRRMADAILANAKGQLVDLERRRKVELTTQERAMRDRANVVDLFNERLRLIYASHGLQTFESLQKLFGCGVVQVQVFICMCEVSPDVTLVRTFGKGKLAHFEFQPRRDREEHLFSRIRKVVEQLLPVTGLPSHVASLHDELQSIVSGELSYV